MKSMHLVLHTSLVDAFGNFLKELKKKKNVKSETSSILESLIGNNFLDVIIADDDEDDIALFQEAIANITDRIKVTKVADGMQLMQKLKSSYLPDLIFLDLNMPRLNGFECLSEISSISDLKDIPIIIYSTSANHDQIEKTYNQGATFYLQKPSTFIDIKILLQKIFTFSANQFFTQPQRADFVLRL